MRVAIFIILWTIQSAFGQSSVAYLEVAEKATLDKVTSDASGAILQFDLVGGLIFIEVTINHNPGTFILDTGAPGVVLNEKPSPISKIYTAGGISGAMPIGEKVINNFKWGIIDLKNINAFTLDISHLEESFERQIDGLIGWNIFQSYELFFDFKMEKVHILDCKRNYLHQYNKPISKLRFTKKGHMPVVICVIDGKKYRFGIDTGAEVNLLSKNAHQALQSAASIVAQQEVQGLDKQLQTTDVVAIDDVLIGNIHTANQQFLVLDFDNINHSPDDAIDGILGFPFLVQHPLSINFRKGKIYFWE